MQLLQPTSLGDIAMANAVVMAPMTRSRAGEGDVATELMAEYYAQRASAGLIITEGTQPSLDGKGYCRTPGLYSEDQVASWRRVTDAVHAKGGKIAVQLMHVGRVAHPNNKDPEARTLAPSAVAADSDIFTESGMQPCVMPQAMTLADIQQTLEDYENAAKNAIKAGFDGVELHCTSGYLPAQFLSTGTNKRQDDFGGNLENRLRFPLEALQRIASAAGAERVGFRICPGNPFNDLHDDNHEETFAAFLQRANELKLAWLHVIRMPQLGLDNIGLARANYDGDLIVNESYTAEDAEAALVDGQIKAVSFGRPFVANPDLPARFEQGAQLAQPDFSRLYSPGPQGYTDYPTL